MQEPEIRYKAGQGAVIWKPYLCIHSGVCWRGLPEVFKPKERVWIKTDGADVDRIIAQVEQCPTGALSFEGARGNDTVKKARGSIRIIPDGPIMIEGPAKVVLPDGSVETKEKNVSLCRCGASSTKPYCDGTHAKINFKG